MVKFLNLKPFRSNFPESTSSLTAGLTVSKRIIASRTSLSRFLWNYPVSGRVLPCAIALRWDDAVIKFRRTWVAGLSPLNITKRRSRILTIKLQWLPTMYIFRRTHTKSGSTLAPLVAMSSSAQHNLLRQVFYSYDIRGRTPNTEYHYACVPAILAPWTPGGYCAIISCRYVWKQSPLEGIKS